VENNQDNDIARVAEILATKTPQLVHLTQDEQSVIARVARTNLSENAKTQIDDVIAGKFATRAAYKEALKTNSPHEIRNLRSKFQDELRKSKAQRITSSSAATLRRPTNPLSLPPWSFQYLCPVEYFAPPFNHGVAAWGPGAETVYSDSPYKTWPGGPVVASYSSTNASAGELSVFAGISVLDYASEYNASPNGQGTGAETTLTFALPIPGGPLTERSMVRVEVDLTIWEPSYGPFASPFMVSAGHQPGFWAAVQGDASILLQAGDKTMSSSVIQTFLHQQAGSDTWGTDTFMDQVKLVQEVIVPKGYSGVVAATIMTRVTALVWPGVGDGSGTVYAGDLLPVAGPFASVGFYDFDFPGWHEYLTLQDTRPIQVTGITVQACPRPFNYSKLV